MPTEKKLQAIAEIGARKEDEELLRQVALKYCVSPETLGRWIINEELLRNRRAKELGVRPEALAAAAEPPPPPRTSPKRPATLTEEVAPPKRSCQRLPSPISDVSPTSSGCRASPNSPPHRRSTAAASSSAAAAAASAVAVAPSSGDSGEAQWPPAERPSEIEPGSSWQRRAADSQGRKGRAEGLGLRASPPHDDFDDLANAKATADLLRCVPCACCWFQSGLGRRFFVFCCQSPLFS